MRFQKLSNNEVGILDTYKKYSRQYFQKTYYTCLSDSIMCRNIFSNFFQHFDWNFHKIRVYIYAYLRKNKGKAKK